jgi:hypothetical protein
MNFTDQFNMSAANGIYFERGYVLEVEIVNVSPMEDNQEGAAFNMAIKRTIQ